MDRNGIHIIDLQQTVGRLNEAYKFVQQLVADGGTLLFVGTKKQAQEAVAEEAKRCGMYYVNQRWLGGMLTNFKTIQLRIAYLRELEARRDNGDFERLPKKEVQRLQDELTRLERILGGIKDMRRLPAAVFIVDTRKERTAVLEARRLEIPIIALADTNCDPDEMDFPIPANDDAIRAVRLLCAKIADAAVEGRREHEALQKDEESPRASLLLSCLCLRQNQKWCLLQERYQLWKRSPLQGKSQLWKRSPLQSRLKWRSLLSRQKNHSSLLKRLISLKTPFCQVGGKGHVASFLLPFCVYRFVLLSEFRYQVSF